MIWLSTVAFASLLPTATFAQTRVAVLPFEGSFADRARDAAVEGLGEFTVLLDADITQSANELNVDVSTPEGTAQAIEHLRVRLVLVGEVRGRGRSARTHLVVQDTTGNELAAGEAAAPAPRGEWAAEIGQKARELVRTANAALPPEPVEGPVMMLDPEPETQPVQAPPPPPEEPRWLQPLVRAYGGVFLRTRTAAYSQTDYFSQDMSPEIDVLVEGRPFAGARDWKRGLFGSLNAGASIGLRYLSRAGGEQGMTSYNFGLNLGYGILIAEMLEATPMIGFGIDGFGLDGRTSNDFPTTTYSFIRPGAMLRFRAFEDLFVIEAGGGFRAVLGAGELGDCTRMGAYCLTSSSFIGFDVFGGFSGNLGMGFAWNARFAFVSHDASFAGAAVRGGSDQSVQVQLLLGWVLPSTAEAAPAASEFEAAPAAQPSNGEYHINEDEDLLNR